MSVSFMTVAVLSIILKAIKIDDAYKSVDWRLLILIGGMTLSGKNISNYNTDAQTCFTMKVSQSGTIYSKASFFDFKQFVISGNNQSAVGAKVLSDNKILIISNATFYEDRDYIPRESTKLIWSIHSL